jgi:hypothetical protein
METDKLIIFQKTYDFLLWLYPIINRLPKNHRLILGKKIEEMGLTLLLSIIKANKKRGEERKFYQDEASDTLDYLRIILRLTKDTHLMSVKQYLVGAEKLNEIGRMLSGWIGVTKSV